MSSAVREKIHRAYAPALICTHAHSIVDSVILSCFCLSVLYCSLTGLDVNRQQLASKYYEAQQASKIMSHPSLLTHLLPIIITTSLSSALSSKSVWLIRARLAWPGPAQPSRVTAVIAFILSKQLSAQILSQGHIPPPFNSQRIQQEKLY